MTNRNEKKRALVVGLDGATFDIIMPMVEKGLLRNFASLLKESSYGSLISTIPPNSSVAWSSFMTGKKPGKHGVYFFMEKQENSYRRPVVSSRSVRAKTLWKLLSEHGKKVIVINVPMTYPPEEVNGSLISGILTPSPEAVFTYPPGLHMDLIAAIGGYLLDGQAVDVFLNSGSQIAAYESLVRGTRKVFEAAKYLMKDGTWDFAMVMFSLADKVQHIAWKYRIPEYQEQFPGECAKFSQVIETSYRLLDDILGEFISMIDEDTSLIIVSDHGFGPIEEKFYVNRWLRDIGLLKLKSGGYLRFNPLKAIRNFVVGPMMRRLLGDRLVSALRRIRRHHLGFAQPVSEAMDSHLAVDWSRTKAYSSWSGGEEVIYINLKGREPQGIVSPGEEYERLREEIIRKLTELRNDAGRTVVEKAYRREEIYPGPYMELAPDIQFVTRNMAVLPRGELFGKPIFEIPKDHSPAMHRLNGILLMKGPDIKKGLKLSDSNIEDVAPTVLHLFGIPIPDDMDGQVIQAAFHDDYFTRHSITYQPAAAESGDLFRPGHSPDTDEQDQIRRHLRGLGYMD